MPNKLRAMLDECVSLDAEELHLKVPNRPMVRAQRRLIPLERAHLTPREMMSLASDLARMADKEFPLNRVLEEEFSFGLPGVGRFRVHLYRQRGTLGAIVRRIATQVPSAADLGLSGDITKRVGEQGLMLIVGSQRQAVVAALVNDYNASQRSFVVLIESPLNFLHRDAMASIAHREVGVDVQSFEAAIRQAARLQADLLVVGDVPDRGAAIALFDAMERGIPVVAAVPVTADNALAYLVRLFPGEERADAEARLERMISGTLIAHQQPFSFHPGRP